MSLKAVSRSQGANLEIKAGSIEPNGFELIFEDWPVLVKAFPPAQCPNHWYSRVLGAGISSR